MSVTSLKLPDELKKRIAALAAGNGRSAHAFMVEAIAREMERAESFREFL
jgi:predicted transcriptional regulator